VFTADAGTAGGNVFDFGGVYVDLGATVFSNWVANGSRGDNIEVGAGTVVHLLSSGASINGIPLDVPDFRTIRVFLQPELAGSGLPPLSQLSVYYLSIVQYAELAGPDSGLDQLRLVGGQLIQIKTAVPNLLIYPRL
jgi:hypothetical protein